MTLEMTIRSKEISEDVVALSLQAENFGIIPLSI